jgi:hypothetical protein
MSQTSTPVNAPDLRTGFPRSPNVQLGLYVLLPRIIDKCRALVAGTHGEYNYNCPLDRRFFDFTKIDAEAFKAEVAKGKTDAELLTWVQEHSVPKTDDELRVWAYNSRWGRPTPEQIAYFEGYRQQVAPNQYNIETWFQVLDAEEGRF